MTYYTSRALAAVGALAITLTLLLQAISIPANAMLGPILA